MRTLIALVAGSVLAGVAAFGAWVYLRPAPVPEPELNRDTTERFGPERRYAPYLMLVPAQPKSDPAPSSKGSSLTGSRSKVAGVRGVQTTVFSIAGINS